MTQRIKRTPNFELTLRISDDTFISTPRGSQRNWLLNRAMKEMVEELDHLDRATASMVQGMDGAQLLQDRAQAALEDAEIMEDWQIPVMRAMAAAVTAAKGDVLEIGFGRGVASDFIQDGQPASHTIVECNDTIIERYERWKKGHANADILMLEGMWQDVMGDAGQFDGILFHTYPLNEAEFVEQVLQSNTFAEHFFDVASRHLRPGGVFTYLTNEADSLSRAHQRSVLSLFKSVSLSRLDELNVPQDTRDAHWWNQIVLVEVTK